MKTSQTEKRLNKIENFCTKRLSGVCRGEGRNERVCVSVAECGLYVCLHVCVASVSVRVGAVFFSIAVYKLLCRATPQKA